MSNSKKNTFQLDIKAANMQDEWINISILDSDNRLMAQNIGSFSVELPKGLYTILTDINGVNNKQVIRHSENTLYYIKTKLIKTKKNKAVQTFPFIEDNKSLEYHNTIKPIPFREGDDDPPTDPPEEPNDVKPIPIKENDTITINPNASLFILFYDLEGSALVESPNNFLLYNIDFEEVTITTPESHLNAKQGWLTFQYSFEEGTYFFAYLGEEERIIPIEIIPEYQTQIILPLIEHKPDFSNLKVLISNRDLISYNEVFAPFEIALQKLQYQDFTLSEGVLKDLVYGKFEKPIYGIVVAYIYLKSESHKFDQLFETVVQNLENRILNSQLEADLRIIKLLKLKHSSEQSLLDQALQEELPFETLPIFRIGLETLIELSYDYPHLISKNSLIDLISDKIYYDTPWTCFRPIKNINTSSNITPPELDTKFVKPRDTINQSQEQLENFLPAFIDILQSKDGKGLTIKELSQCLRIPPATLERKLKVLAELLSQGESVSSILKNIPKNWFKAEIEEKG